MWYKIFSCFDTCWQCLKKRHLEGAKQEITYDPTELISTSISLDTGVISQTFMQSEDGKDQLIL